MAFLTPKSWTDYELLDSGNGKRLERFGIYTLVRPDPQCIWKPHLPESQWQKADACFETSSSKGEKGQWKFNKKLPDKWLIHHQNLSFWVKLSPFKHTGVFPEQAIHWEFLSNVIAGASEAIQLSIDCHALPVYPFESEQPQSRRPERTCGEPCRTSRRAHNDENDVRVLNLFGYTGAASLAAASAGARVTHVDASYPAIGWARENQTASGLEKKPIRWILDDCLKFSEREIRRNVKYDGIIMDPPVYGHGPKGEIWDFNKDFPKLMSNCRQLLSDRPLFVIVNAYAVSASSIMLENVLNDYLKDLGGSFETGELALQEKDSKRLLSTGIFTRWSRS